LGSSTKLVVGSLLLGNYIIDVEGKKEEAFKIQREGRRNRMRQGRVETCRNPRAPGYK
jgi:hypothetical protein